jgi:hypothetical protein
MWLRPTSASPSDDDEVSDSEVVSNDKEYLLSELTRRIAGQNTINATKMTAKGGANRTYSVGQIVSLAIPPKNRLSAEATRLPYRVLKITKGAYTLLSLHGQLKGLHQGSSLKAIPTNEDFGILMEANPSKKPITLPAAVTLSNNRKSILAQ